MSNLAQPPDPIDEVTEAEERRAAEEALIAERNQAQHEAEADGSEERVLLLPPEGYAVPPTAPAPGDDTAHDEANPT